MGALKSQTSRPLAAHGSGIIRTPRAPSCVNASHSRCVTAPASTPQAAKIHCRRLEYSAGAAYSRQREYAADAAGVKLVGHQFGLISALQKLGEYNKRIPMNVSPTTASLYIVMPLTFGGVFKGLFSTHPPLSERIAVLRNMTITR